FGAGEVFGSDANDGEKVGAHPKIATDHRGIFAEAALPVIVGENDIGRGTIRAIVGVGKKAAQDRLETKDWKHRAGDVVEVGLFHLGVGRVGDVDAIAVRDSNQVGLIGNGGAHLEVKRILVGVTDAKMAAEVGTLVSDDIEALGMRDR